MTHTIPASDPFCQPATEACVSPNTFSVFVTGGDLDSNPNLVKYLFHLEGYEQDWFVTGQSNIRYSGIPPGEYRLWAQAVDQDLVYSEPISLSITILPYFWQTPVFALGSIAGLALAGVASYRVARRYRAARAVRRGFNPYEAGRPIVEPERHFGREDVIRFILNGLPRNHFAVYGPRRIGKTSLLHQLENRIAALRDPEATFLPVFVELQRAGPADLFYVMMHPIAAAARRRAPTLDLIADTRREGYDNIDFVDDLQRVVDALDAAGGKSAQIVLLIDEGDQINELDIAAQRQLRGVFMEAIGRRLTMIWSGAQIQPVRDYASPWYNLFAQEIRLDALDEADARALIVKPAKGVYRYTDEALERILELTGRRPYAIQRLCHTLINRALAREKSRRSQGPITIALDDVEAAREALPQMVESEA